MPVEKASPLPWGEGQGEGLRPSASGTLPDELLPAVLPLLADTSPLVRGMAVWAVRMLANAELAETLKAKHCADERDAGVLAEWDCAL